MCYLICYTRSTTEQNTSQNGHRHRCVLIYFALFSSLFHLFRFRVIVFHSKQKHEEGERLLHYLQQTNTELANCTFIDVTNQGTCGN